ncbi:hypothetical protein FKW77_008264 [Venturia effusa]|uniref:Topoisomerase 1-associated factor 1 n=1 Tax=Venturia effusa TaxID=50376 RepID=A0A517LJA9_9PEZI|nr:hypothetical protein FKW77_008264 [Venturia effusa]
MDGTLDEWVTPASTTVDPEVRAYVSSLITALGGISIEHHGAYVLGDSALECLKDLRRWLKLYDQKLDRLDVQRVLAESNLVKGDLLEILAGWKDGALLENKLRYKIATSCLELLVLLTWPIEKDNELMKVNHHRHLPYLRLAQVEYKRAILHHDIAQILRTVLQIGLPSMAIPKTERSERDESIIRLELYLLRNVAMIEQPKDLPADEDEVEVSRSATIDAFKAQDVFQVLLTVASSMGEDFVLQDVQVLEVLFHLLKGIDPDKVFMEEKKISKANADEFKNLVQEERSLLSEVKRNAPTRHNRFGTMVWLKRDDDKVSTMTGQDVLKGSARAADHMDKSKRWNKPKYKGKQNLDEKPSSGFNKFVELTSSARGNLRHFVTDFLDSSFNPLFQHLRKAVEREAERLETDRHPMQFFYLISWFLQAECARRRSRKERKAAHAKIYKAKDAPPAEEEESFGLVASVLNQETFVLLNRFMQRAQDDKEWNQLNAGMKCLTQILLIVQEMAASPLEDDQDIAENIQSRIFYEESTHERVLHLLRTYKDQGLGYLDACTELSHVFIRMLEQYSKQNVDLHIRSRRRARRKKKEAQAAEGVEYNGDDDNDVADIEQVQAVSRERKFDFARFVARFMTQASVDTFVHLTRYYKDLSKEQLKRAHRFFYRVAFKNELSVMLFRVDIIQLFHTMIKGPNGLNPEMPYFKEWSDFAQQLFRRLIKRLEDRPGLLVELLFSKIPSTVFYLEHGYDNKVEKIPRPPAELEVKPGMEWHQEIGVVVSILINQNKSDALAWLKKVMTDAKDERQAWQDLEIARKAAAREAVIDAAGLAEAAEPSIEAEEDAGPKAPSILVRPDTDERRKQLFKDNKLRLLMTLCGFLRLGEADDPEASWIIPTSVEPSKLEEAVKIINGHEYEPPTFEDGKAAESFLRSKAAAERAVERRERKAVFDDDSDNGIDYEEEFEFEAGGPTNRKSELEKMKKTRKIRRRKEGSDDEDESLSEEMRKKRRDQRREAELEKRRKIKSEMYVHSSDDATDEERDKEFFAQEEIRRNNAGKNFLRALETGTKVSARESTKKRKATASGKTGGKKKKRKGIASLSGSDDDNSPNVVEDDEEQRIIAISSEEESSDGESDVVSNNEADATDTPLSSQPHAPSPAVDKVAAPRVMDTTMKDAANESEDKALPVRSAVRRRGGFVVESDSE